MKKEGQGVPLFFATEPGPEEETVPEAMTFLSAVLGGISRETTIISGIPPNVFRRKNVDIKEQICYYIFNNSIKC